MTDNASLTTRTEFDTQSSMRIDDIETRGVVSQQYNIERYTTYVLMALSFAVCIKGASGSILKLIPSALIAYIGYWFWSKTIRFAIFKPMRSMRCGACVNRILQVAKTQIDYAKGTTWKTPVPRVIAINPSIGKLFIEGPDTGYCGLTLMAAQILEAKVEREQRIETFTLEDSRLIYSFGSPNFSILGGGSSRSTSKVVESACLEISYVLDMHNTPRSVMFPFMGQRRDADDWALAINHMRTRN